MPQVTRPLELNGGIGAFAAWDDGSGPRLYAGGWFSGAGGRRVDGITRWQGGSWAPLSDLEQPGVDFWIDVLADFDDGNGSALYAGGFFTTAGGVAARSIAKWDGSTWTALEGPAGNGIDGQVLALVVFDDGSGPALYAGGCFATAGGIAAQNIARWDGSSWHSMGLGSTDCVQALAVFDDGTGPMLYAGAGVQGNGEQSGAGVSRWDGSAWSTLGTATGEGTFSYVSALTVFDDGNGAALYAGGYFPTMGGVTVNHVAKWDGTVWSPLAGPSGVGVDSSVYTLGVHDDGNGPALYVGGELTQAGGREANRLARWDGTDWSAVTGPAGNGMDGEVFTIGSFDDGAGPTLWVGGIFTTAGGIPSRFIARWGSAANVFAGGFETGDFSGWSQVVGGS